jgi:hypothetical protein
MTAVRSKAPPSRRLVVLVASTLILVLAVALFFAASRERIVPLGRPQRFDDFGFAVVNVHRLEAIEGLRPERGTFLVVRLGIRNQAKRVDYQFQPDTAFVEDARGLRFPVSAEATRRRSESSGGLPPCDRPIIAGSSCTTDLVFDVPASVRRARFGLPSGAVGDFLDRLLEGKVRFALYDEPR